MRQWIFLTIFLSGLLGCQTKQDNTVTGNPLVSLAVSGSSQVATVARTLWHHLFDLTFPRAIALPPPTGVVDSAGNLVIINQMWITIRDIEFKFEEASQDSEVDGSEVTFVGPYTIDLLSAAPSTLATGTISRSQARRIKIRMTKTNPIPAGGPSLLLDKTIYIAGTVNGVSFTYVNPDETELEVSGPQILSIVENDRLLVQISTANLIKRINLSAISVSTAISDSNRVSQASPCPSVNSSASDLYTCFRSGLQSEANLGKDSNLDFELSAAESSVK